MSARPKPGALLCRVSEIADPGAIVREFAEGEARFSLVIARRGAVIAAYENVCPHARFPLERFDGRVLVLEGRYLLCAGHGASFAIETGACVGGPGVGRGLTRFAIDVRGDEVRAA